MKPPANFTAGATKKVNPLEAAINSNFEQNSMPKAAEKIGSEAREAPQTGANGLPEQNTRPSPQQALVSEEKSQILNAKPESPAAEDKEAKIPARREVKEKFLVSMSKGERSIFKAFCAMQNVSMNHFVMCSIDYFKEDLENGKVSISSHSYKRKEN